MLDFLLRHGEFEANHRELDALFKLGAIPKFGSPISRDGDERFLSWILDLNRIFRAKTGPFVAVADIVRSDLIVSLLHELFLNDILNVFNMDEGLVTIFDAVGHGMSHCEGRSGVFLQGEEGSGDRLLDLTFRPRDNIAVTTNQADRNLLLWFGINRNFASRFEGTLKDERFSNIVSVIFDESLFNEEVEIVLGKLEVAPTLDLVHQRFGNAVGHRGNERTVLFGKNIILGCLTGDQEVGERFADRISNVGEGKLLFISCTRDGDFRDGVALGGRKDFAPGERSTGSGAVSDCFFEGLVFGER